MPFDCNVRWFQQPAERESDKVSACCTHPPAAIAIYLR